jgi:uncharacterized protein (UPF0548 family)
MWSEDMTYPAGSIPVWFNRDRQLDAQYLSAWREAPVTYDPDQVVDHHWNADHYETVLGKDGSGSLFERAAVITLMNQFYPPDVLVTTSDFGVEKRPVQVGDRVLQRIRLFQIAGRPIYDVLTLNEITEVVQETRRVGFTYNTTSIHSEIGEWSSVVEWRGNGEVVLVIDVISRALPGAAAVARWFTRRMQLRAHTLSVQNFQALLRLRPASPQRDTFPAEILPVGLLGTAFLLLLAAVFSLGRKSE